MGATSPGRGRPHRPAGRGVRRHGGAVDAARARRPRDAGSARRALAVTAESFAAILAALLVAGVGAFGVAARLRQQANLRRALDAQAHHEAATLAAARTKAAADQHAREAVERIHGAATSGGLADIVEAGRRTPPGEEP